MKIVQKKIMLEGQNYLCNNPPESEFFSDFGQYFRTSGKASWSHLSHIMEKK